VAQFDIVDLSTDVVDHADGPFATRLEVIEATPGAQILADQVVPRLVPELAGRLRPEHLPGSAFLRHETLTASVHAGSHIDAPGHYGGTLSAGAFINDAQPSHFIGPGILFDASDVDGPEVRWEHLGSISRDQRNRDPEDLVGKIVLIRIAQRASISALLVEALLDRGVNVIGTNGASFDGPFERSLEVFQRTNDPSALWPCHVLGRSRRYYQIEGLANLDRLPPRGFFVWAPPVMVRGATAAWTRALALVPRARAAANGELATAYRTRTNHIEGTEDACRAPLNHSRCTPGADI